MREAIGFIEIRGLVGALEAADTMVKAADVTISDFQVVGSGLISVMVSGDVAAVTAAVESARYQIENLGELISANVIPRPHDDIGKLISMGD